MSLGELTEARSIFSGARADQYGPQDSGTPMSREEFFALHTDDVEQGYRYELIHGVLIVSPSPGAGERGPNSRLDQWFWNYHESNPVKSTLDDTLPEQDIDTRVCLRRADRAIWAGLGRQPNLDTDVPTIVIEFVSQSSRDRRRDYEEKRKEYSDIGVKEYWIIDRFRRTLTVCCGDEVCRIVKGSEAYTTELLPGFELPLAELLAIADRWEESK